MTGLLPPDYTDKEQRRLGVVVTFDFIAAMLIVMFFLFSGNILSILIPLSVFTAAIVLAAAYQYWEDADLIRIRQIIAGDFYGVAEVMSGNNLGDRYGLTQQERHALNAVAGADPIQIRRVQGLYLRYYLVSGHARESVLVVANLALVVIGAALSSIVPRQLVPDPAAIPNLWRDPTLLLPLATSLLRSLPVWILIIVFSLYFWSELRARRSLVQIREAVSKAPAEVITRSLRPTQEVKRKFRTQLQHAVALLGYSRTMQEAVNDLRGLDERREWRPSSLVSIELMMFSFGFGLFLGALLPPLLGLSQ